MKFSNISFLAKANIRGNKQSGAITALTCLFVVAVTVVSCFSIVTVSSLNEAKTDYMGRAAFLTPFFKPITEQAKKAILSVEHTELIDDATAMGGETYFDIIGADELFSQKTATQKSACTYISGLNEHEKKSVIKGETLDNTPTFSCLVPSLFYPFELDSDNIHGTNLDYIDGTELVGKTITLKSNIFSINYWVDMGESAANDTQCAQAEARLSPTEFKLKIVGCYNCSYAARGSQYALIISKETELLMIKAAMEETGIDLSSDSDPLAVWWNTPTLHDYYVLCDDRDNIPKVFDKVRKMGYDIGSTGERYIPDSQVILANLFSTVGVFFIFAVAVVSVIILAQSSVASMRERRGIIGLMKAIGYKNRQIFACLCFEQLYLTLRSFLIGGAISAAFVGVTNYIFSHGTLAQMQYIISTDMFLGFLTIALAAAIAVPIVCRTLMLKRLFKIQPRDAMTAV